MKDKLKKILKENWLIVLIISISSILHILTLCELGFNYTLNSDDASYIQSGITFYETGAITMHGAVSAQIMPGMTFLIAFFCLLFGTGQALVGALKIFWIIMGITTIVMVYKSIKLFTKPIFAALPCLFFLAIDYIWMDNIILTETPYILLFTLLIYHTFKLGISPNKKDYIFILIYYIISVFIRPNIGTYPCFLIIYLLLKKYDFKLLIRQTMLAGILLILCLTPWTIRNYKLFDKFIPLTYGMGNPLLLGTYQGYNYPLDEELDYKKNVDEKLSEEMKHHMSNDYKEDCKTKYYLLEYDGMKAKYRMQEWWKKDKLSMLKSYLLYKPYVLFYNSFYWDTVLGISGRIPLVIRVIEIFLFVFSSIIILIDKKNFEEWLFLILVLLSQIALYAYSFAFSRYAISMFFIRYIIIGIGIEILYKRIKERRNRHESISDNSSI